MLSRRQKEENPTEVVVPMAEKDINAAHEDAIQYMCCQPSYRRRRKGGCGNCPGGLLSQPPDKVRNVTVSPSSSCLLMIFFLLCSVLMAWVLSNMSCRSSLPLHERRLMTNLVPSTTNRGAKTSGTNKWSIGALSLSSTLSSSLPPHCFLWLFTL